MEKLRLEVALAGTEAQLRSALAESSQLQAKLQSHYQGKQFESINFDSFGK